MAANNEQTLQVGTSSKEKNVEEGKEESKVCKIIFLFCVVRNNLG